VRYADAPWFAIAILAGYLALLAAFFLGVLMLIANGIYL